MQQEMETDDDHATVRDNFSLVQNILFCDYPDTLPAQSRKTRFNHLPAYMASVCTGVFEIYILECVRLKYIC